MTKLLSSMTYCKRAKIATFHVIGKHHHKERLATRKFIRMQVYGNCITANNMHLKLRCQERIQDAI